MERVQLDDVMVGPDGTHLLNGLPFTGIGVDWSPDGKVKSQRICQAGVCRRDAHFDELGRLVMITDYHPAIAAGYSYEPDGSPAEAPGPQD